MIQSKYHLVMHEIEDLKKANEMLESKKIALHLVTMRKDKIVYVLSEKVESY